MPTFYLPYFSYFVPFLSCLSIFHFFFLFSLRETAIFKQTPLDDGQQWCELSVMWFKNILLFTLLAAEQHFVCS